MLPKQKGFSSLIAILITIAIIASLILVYFKMAEKNLQKSNSELNQINNLVPNDQNQENQNQSQGVQQQLNNLRGSINNITEKKDQEILDELNK